MRGSYLRKERGENMDSNAIIRFDGWIIWKYRPQSPYGGEVVIATEESWEGAGRVYLRNNRVIISTGDTAPNRVVSLELLDKMRELAQAPVEEEGGEDSEQ